MAARDREPAASESGRLKSEPRSAPSPAAAAVVAPVDAGDRYVAAERLRDGGTAAIAPGRRAWMIALAVVLGTGAFFWASSVLSFIYMSLPGSPGEPMFSVAGAALQSLVGIGGALALLVVAIAIGDRATGGARAAWRPALTLAAGGSLAAWLLLTVTSP